MFGELPEPIYFFPYTTDRSKCVFPSSAVLLPILVWMTSTTASGAWAQAIPTDTIGPSISRWSAMPSPAKAAGSSTFDCQNVELLSYLPPSAMGEGPDFLGYGSVGSFDIWGWVDSTTNREFAIVGGSDGTSFVEVTDPVNPRYLGKLFFHGGAQGLAGVKVYKNYAFVVVEAANAGMQIFDLTQLRDVKNAPATFQETAHYGEFGNAHTITMNQATGFAYPTGIGFGAEPCGSGLHMIDVRTPTKPTFAGCYTNPMEGTQYVHDTMCLLYQGPDQQYKGREICSEFVVACRRDRGCY